MNTDNQLQAIAKRAARNIIIGFVVAVAVLAIGFGMALLSSNGQAVNPALILLLATTIVPICLVYPVIQMLTVLHKHHVQNTWIITVLTLITLFALPVAAPLVAYFGITKLGKA